MTEKKGRFIIQEVKEVKEPINPQVSPKRWDSFNIIKKLTIKSLGSFQSKNGSNMSMSFVYDFNQGTWIGLSKLWLNAVMMNPDAAKMCFNIKQCMLKKSLKERFFLS